MSSKGPARATSVGRISSSGPSSRSAVGVCGAPASDVFLLSLDAADEHARGRILARLPAADRWARDRPHYHLCKDVGADNNLILERIHKPQAGASVAWLRSITAGDGRHASVGGSRVEKGTAGAMGGKPRRMLAGGSASIDRTRRILLMTASAAASGPCRAAIAGSSRHRKSIAIGPDAYERSHPA